ncbi:hypothetical protein SELMODRAFT_419335 [Selaginella moellendorffii]|uniref:Peptidase S1 domain-containing protein n=1 Tax=Selaginella moellendorffii TaxID=88036 RepID=D8S8L1_SELML|nr:hypothetical protein SELMODRAFT_419335 [Selaginella moellendorffii]
MTKDSREMSQKRLQTSQRAFWKIFLSSYQILEINQTTEVLQRRQDLGRWKKRRYNLEKSLEIHSLVSFKAHTRRPGQWMEDKASVGAMHAQEHCGADDGRHLLEGLVTNVFVVLGTAMEHKRGGIQITGIIKSLKAPANVIKMLQDREISPFIKPLSRIRNRDVREKSFRSQRVLPSWFLLVVKWGRTGVMDDLATVVDSKHAITFAHEGHSVWQVGHVFTFRHPFKQTVQEVPVILEVEALFRNSDLILLRRMYVRHGVVSEDSEEASSIRTNGFLMGDSGSVKGESGGGLFVADSGALIGMNIGVNHEDVFVSSSLLMEILG